MADWVDKLSDGEKAEWEAFVDHFRRDALQKITDSSAFISIAPPSDKFDAKFAMELGAAIILNKKLLLLTPEGREVSPKLLAVADEIVEADIDTEEGQEKLRVALDIFMLDVPPSEE